MTTYWKSTPKHYCALCKVFITDNTQSIRTHESGYRHRELIKNKLYAAKNAKYEKDMQDRETKSALAEIEKAALAAYQEDLANGTITQADSNINIQNLEETIRRKQMQRNQKNQLAIQNYQPQAQTQGLAQGQGHTNENEAAYQIWFTHYQAFYKSTGADPYNYFTNNSTPSQANYNISNNHNNVQDKIAGSTLPQSKDNNNESNKDKVNEGDNNNNDEDLDPPPGIFISSDNKKEKEEDKTSTASTADNQKDKDKDKTDDKEKDKDKDNNSDDDFGFPIAVEVSGPGSGSVFGTDAPDDVDHANNIILEKSSFYNQKFNSQGKPSGNNKNKKNIHSFDSDEEDDAEGKIVKKAKLIAKPAPLPLDSAKPSILNLNATKEKAPISIAFKKRNMATQIPANAFKS